MDSVDHVVLTRFNLPTAGLEGLMRSQEGWLRDRVELFERYCFPSVAAQTRSPIWLVYFDPDSPAWLTNRIRDWTGLGGFQPVFRTSVSIADLVFDLRAAVPDPAVRLVTTNLDNDDGLASDFSERVTAVPPRDERCVIYFTHGLILRGDQAYLRRDRLNAFCSVSEGWDHPVTAWSEYHNEFPKVMPAARIAGSPAWLQVVHSSNVSNRVRGRLVPATTYSDGFGSMLDGAREPSWKEILRDSAIGVPTRTLRDVARATGRTVGLRLLGKSRYQDLRRFVASVLRRG